MLPSVVWCGVCDVTNCVSWRSASCHSVSGVWPSPGGTVSNRGVHRVAGLDGGPLCRQGQTPNPLENPSLNVLRLTGITPKFKCLQACCRHAILSHAQQQTLPLKRHLLLEATCLCVAFSYRATYAAILPVNDVFKRPICVHYVLDMGL